MKRPADAAMLDGILAGVRVVDLTQNVAGPFCTQVLGDLGADVVKVERPGAGDDARGWRSAEPDSVSPHFVAANRNKRSVCIDLGRAEGTALLRRLIGQADVFVHALKPASARSRGLDYDSLAPEAPRLVYCAISAYGGSGPLGELPGYDPVMQAYTGLMSLTGGERDGPARIPVSVIDIGAGLWAALGVLAACLRRERTGRGGSVQTSLLETGLAWLGPLIAAYQINGRTPQRMGTAMGNAAPYELFAAADGHVFIATPNDALFARACRALGCPELAADPRFSANAGRLERRAELHALLEARTLRRSVRDNVTALRAEGVPCSEMNDLAQALREPQVQAVDMLAPQPLAQHPDFRAVSLPLRMDGERSRAMRPAPALGEHTDEVLGPAGLGLSAGEIAALRQAGIVA